MSITEIILLIVMITVWVGGHALILIIGEIKWWNNLKPKWKRIYKGEYIVEDDDDYDI